MVDNNADIFYTLRAFLLSPPRGGGAYLFQAHLRGGGLNKDQGQWFPYDDFYLKLPTPSPQKSED